MTQPPVFALRAVKHLLVGDAIVCGDMTLVRRRPPQAGKRYVTGVNTSEYVFTHGDVTRTWRIVLYGDYRDKKANDILGEIALLLAEHGYNRARACVVYDYAFYHMEDAG